jgi:hypothetical protein
MLELFSLCSFLNVRDQAAHPYITKVNITVHFCSQSTSLIIRPSTYDATICFKSLRLTACYLKKNNPYFRIVLYGCETWSVTRREEHRLKVCEDRVLRETTGGNRMVGTAHRWAGHVARRHKRNVQERKLEGKAHWQVVSKEGTSISCVQLTAQYRNQTVWQ